MSDKIAKKKAEVALLEAEAAFSAKKKAGKLTDKDRHELRALRQSFRDNHRSPVVDGASVEAIGAKAKVNN